MSTLAPPQKIRFGDREYNFPGQSSDPVGLEELRDANDLLGNVPALQARMAEDGYLFLRNFLPRERVLKARQTILQYMAEHEAMEPGSQPLDGVMGQYGKSIGLVGRKGITHHPDVLAVLEAPELFAFYSQYFAEPARSFDFKWLRAVGHEKFTGAHYDIVYMGRGSRRVMTCWIPLGDIPIQQGVLTMLPKSHNLPGFQKLRDTYGKVDVDKDGIDGKFTSDPLMVTQKFGGRWAATAEFHAGDIMTFGMYTMHASTTNTTDHWRLSCDVRFQPASDPMDNRWKGDNPTGHELQGAGKAIDKQVLDSWGL